MNEVLSELFSKSGEPNLNRDFVMLSCPGLYSDIPILKIQKTKKQKQIKITPEAFGLTTYDFDQTLGLSAGVKWGKFLMDVRV